MNHTHTTTSAAPAPAGGDDDYIHLCGASRNQITGEEAERRRRGGEMAWEVTTAEGPVFLVHGDGLTAMDAEGTVELWGSLIPESSKIHSLL